jgi:hypothetical protein
MRSGLKVLFERRYAVLVDQIDEPTAEFLRASAADLQRQLGIAGDVETIWIGTSPAGVGLRARIRVADEAIEVEGSGNTILAAHADLCRRVAEPTLVSAFRQVAVP